jgi:hypothetical protein
MKTIIKCIPVFLLVTLGLCGGCSNPPKARALDLNEVPAVMNIAKNMSKNDALTTIQTTFAATPRPADYDVSPDGIHAPMLVTRPAEYAPEMFDESPSLNLTRPNWTAPGYENRQIIPQEQMTVSVFLPFADIDRLTDSTFSTPGGMLHQITLYAGPNKHTQLPVDNTRYNDFLAALYTLCPKLHQ